MDDSQKQVENYVPVNGGPNETEVKKRWGFVLGRVIKEIRLQDFRTVNHNITGPGESLCRSRNHKRILKMLYFCRIDLTITVLKTLKNN